MNVQNAEVVCETLKQARIFAWVDYRDVPGEHTVIFKCNQKEYEIFNEKANLKDLIWQCANVENAHNNLLLQERLLAEALHPSETNGAC